HPAAHPPRLSTAAAHHQPAASTYTIAPPRPGFVALAEASTGLTKILPLRIQFGWRSSTVNFAHAYQAPVGRIRPRWCSGHGRPRYLRWHGTRGPTSPAAIAGGTRTIGTAVADWVVTASAVGAWVATP